MDILFWILLFEPENWHFNSEICYLTSKKLIWSKIWYLNSELLFGILNVYFNSKKYWLNFKGFLY